MARTSKTGITVASIKQSELYGVIGHARGEALPLQDPVIEQKLFAAEDFYERVLHLRWAPTRVLSTPETRQNAADPVLRVTDFDPILDLSEPAYDYPRELWAHERHGFLKLRHRPIRDIQQVVFTWAGVFTVWRVPDDWIQRNASAGTINIVPTSGPQFAMMSFNTFLMTWMAGGRGLPHSIVVDYTAGFSAAELEARHQDLLNGVRLLTLLLLGGIASVIASGGVQSTSLSIDGLSHSRGFGGKYGAYSGAIQLAIEQERAIREAWRATERGALLTIC